VLKGWRARRLADRAEKVLQADGIDAALRLVEAELDDVGAEPLVRLALALTNADDNPGARRLLARALEIEADRADALLLLADIDREDGRLEEAAAVLSQVHARFPKDRGTAEALVTLLLELERPAEALAVVEACPQGSSLPLEIGRGKALWAAGRSQEAGEHLTALGKAMRVQLQSLFSRAEWQVLKEQYDEVELLRQQVIAETEGAEKVVMAAAAEGQLDARAGANYHLLGEALMAEDPPWMGSLELASPADERALGERLLKAGEPARGLTYLGVAALRTGATEKAEDCFRRAHKEEPKAFAPLLGLGAALNHGEFRLLERVQRLPAPAGEGALGELVRAIVPEWERLTDDERRVVWAAAAPLGGVLPHVAEAGAIIRLLPIDARLVDLPAFAPGSGERAEDHRCIDAITGAAVADTAASKIEGLLDVDSPGGWVFAHELAHLAYFHMPEPLAADVRALYLRATEVGYASRSYALSNDHEMFAESYTDHLRRRYKLTELTQPDDDGVSEAIDDLFQRMSGGAV
jgi:tetratricopeptide (TPR) repeat protein